MVNVTNSNSYSYVNIKIADLIKKSEFLVKGSESFIYLETFLGKKIILKERKPKKYRLEELDSELRLHRLRIESRMIKSALNCDIQVPALFSIDLLSFSMGLELVKGKNLGSILFDKKNLDKVANKKQFLKDFGIIVSKLHNIDIIHGDLTPLNILISENNTIHIIDFGLSYYSNEIKDKAMDIFILYGSLKIFPQQNEDLFDMFLEGYKIVHRYDTIIANFNKLTNKGRYK